MPREIVSPVKRFSGNVTLASPLTFPQYDAVTKAFENARALGENGEILQADFDKALLPALCACVEKWALGGGFPAYPTPETFPATPRRASAEIVAWLVREITAEITEADELPNA